MLVAHSLACRGKRVRATVALPHCDRWDPSPCHCTWMRRGHLHKYAVVTCDDGSRSQSPLGFTAELSRWTPLPVALRALNRGQAHRFEVHILLTDMDKYRPAISQLLRATSHLSSSGASAGMLASAGDALGAVASSAAPAALPCAARFGRPGLTSLSSGSGCALGGIASRPLGASPGASVGQLLQAPTGALGVLPGALPGAAARTLPSAGITTAAAAAA